MQNIAIVYIVYSVIHRISLTEVQGLSISHHTHKRTQKADYFFNFFFSPACFPQEKLRLKSERIKRKAAEKLLCSWDELGVMYRSDMNSKTRLAKYRGVN